jgi:hypothetical protein
MSDRGYKLYKIVFSTTVYVTGIQKLYIREGHAMQWEKKKENKTSNDLQNITQKTKD